MSQQKKLVKKAHKVQERIDNAARPKKQKITYSDRPTTGRKK